MTSKKQTTLEVSGMTCHSCIRHVDRALREVDGVSRVNVRLRDGQVDIEHDDEAALSTMIEALDEAGYPARRRIAIEVLEDGFSPEAITVKAGEPVTLAFTRRVERTCAKQVAIQLGDGQKVQRTLPLGETVTIDATFAATGQLAYACPMDMITGVITVE